MSITPHSSPAPIESWEVLDLLTSLVEKSLVLYEEQDGKGRYRLLETIRQYGHEKLEGSEEASAARDRHRDWYLAADEQRKLDHQADLENLEAALEWSMQRGDAEAALRLGGALFGFWYSGYMREGRERLEKALSLPGAEAPTLARARALSRAGYFALRLGDNQGARELLEGALTIGRQLGDQEIIGWSLSHIGNAAMMQGDHQRARALFEERLATARQSGDQDSIRWGLYRLGVLADLEGDYEGARPLLEQSVAISRQMGDRYGIGGTLEALGVVARKLGDYQGARALLEESLEVRRQLGAHADVASSLEGLADVARSQGDYERARALYKEVLGFFRQAGEQLSIAAVLEGLAGLAAANDQAERAARLFGAAEALRAAIASPLAPGERADYDRYVAATHAALGEEAFAAAWASGRSMTVDQAISCALE